MFDFQLILNYIYVHKYSVAIYQSAILLILKQTSLCDSLKHDPSITSHQVMWIIICFDHISGLERFSSSLGLRRVSGSQDLCKPFYLQLKTLIIYHILCQMLKPFSKFISDPPWRWRYLDHLLILFWSLWIYLYANVLYVFIIMRRDTVMQAPGICMCVGQSLSLLHGLQTESLV